MAYTLWQQEMFDAYLYSQICAHTQNAEKEEEKKTGDRNPKCTKEHRIYTLLSCWAQSWANDSILHVCHLENVQINPKQWRNEEATACAPYCIFNRMWSKMCLLRYLCTFFLRRILCWTTLLIFMLKSSHPVLHTTSDHLAPIILRMYGKWDDNRLQAMHCTHVSVQSHCVCVCLLIAKGTWKIEGIDIRHFVPLSGIAYDKRYKNTHNTRILEIYSRDDHILRKRCTSNIEHFKVE